MSEMEIYIGTYEKSDLDLEPEDTDEFIELEEEHGCKYVKVDGQLYVFHEILNVDSQGFNLTIPPSDKTYCVLYWYNGGADVREVMEWYIQSESKTS